MAIDASTDIGRLRLRIADTGDLPYFPDNVYESVLLDNNGNLPKTAKVMALYLLGMLSHETHRKLNQLEVYGNQSFEQYKQYLLLTVNNPAFMDISAIPYVLGGGTNSPILDFQRDWNKNFYNRTEAQQLAVNADVSPNSGSRTGFTLYAI